MKKYLIIIFAAIVGVFVSSCTEKEIVTYHPGDLTAPVLSELAQSEYTLAEGGAFADFNFTKSSVGLSASIQYELFATLSGDDAKPKSLGKVTNGEKITVDANTINNVLIGLECAADQPVVVNFYVTSNWMSQSNKPIGVAATSNTISATVTPFYAEKEYGKVYVIGTYNSWKHENDTFLYNYKEDDNNYEGVIDFGTDHAANAFKITGVPDWDHEDQNWGVAEKNAEPKDPATLQMIAGSSSQDILNYQTYRYYYFSLNKNSLLLSKDYGFDKLGVIGLNGDWDNDIEMTWNPWKGRWYADVDAASDTEFKFRLDGGWDNNWGGASGVCEKGGANIPIQSGQYRIYFYMGLMTYTIDANMYGKDEPGKAVEPEPPVEIVGWGLIGEIGDSNWDKDFSMTQEDSGTPGAEAWVSEVVNLKGQFKLRKDGKWDENRGATGDAEPVEIVVGMPTDVVSGGKNFTVKEPGMYKVTYIIHPMFEKILVESMGNKWTLIGEVDGSNWDKDIYMTESEGVWTSEPVLFANKDGEAGIFKIRYNNSWDDANTRGAAEADFVFTAGEEFEVVSPGNNIKAPSGSLKYIVSFTPETNKVTIVAALPQNLWGLIGGVEGSSWDKDFYMTQDPTGAWISDPVTINGGFKIRFNNDWDVNRGGAFAEFGKPFAVSQDGANIELPTYDVKYQIVYYPDMEQICVLPCADAFSLIGQYNGKNWDYDVMMKYIETANVWVSDIFYVNKEEGFKIRQNCDWAVNFGGVNTAVGEPFAALAGGDNITVAESGYYMLTYNVADATLVINNAWGLVGQVNGSSWDKDFWLRKNGKDTSISAPFTVEGGFKLRAAGAWTANRGGSFAALDTPFAVVHDGANIEIPSASGKYTLVYNSADETITVSAAN